jgi:hypothetical protein
MRSVEPIVASGSSSKSFADLSDLSIARPQLEQAILDLLHTEPIVEVAGEPGSGKTTALALLAKNSGFEFFSAGGSQANELIQSITNRLRGLRAAGAEYFLSRDAALTALKEEFERHREITLVIDDLFDDQFRNGLYELLKASEGAHRLVYSTSDSKVPLAAPLAMKRSHQCRLSHLCEIKIDFNRLHACHQTRPS